LKSAWRGSGSSAWASSTPTPRPAWSGSMSRVGTTIGRSCGPSWCLTHGVSATCRPRAGH